MWTDDEQERDPYRLFPYRNTPPAQVETPAPVESPVVASSPPSIEPQTPIETPPPDEIRQPMPAARPSGGGGGGFDILGAIAAFTENPALIEMVRHRNEGPERARRAAAEDNDRLLRWKDYQMRLAESQGRIAKAGQKKPLDDPDNPMAEVVKEGMRKRLFGQADLMEANGKAKEAEYVRGHAAMLENIGPTSISSLQAFAKDGGPFIKQALDDAWKDAADVTKRRGQDMFSASAAAGRAMGLERQGNVAERQKAAFQRSMLNRKDTIESLGQVEQRASEFQRIGGLIDKAFTGVGAGQVTNAAWIWQQLGGSMPEELRTTDQLRTALELIAAPMKHGMYGANFTVPEQALAGRWMSDVSMTKEQIKQMMPALQKYQAIADASRLNGYYSAIGKPLPENLLAGKNAYRLIGALSAHLKRYSPDVPDEAQAVWHSRLDELMGGAGAAGGGGAASASAGGGTPTAKPTAEDIAQLRSFAARGSKTAQEELDKLTKQGLVPNE